MRIWAPTLLLLLQALLITAWVSTEPHSPRRTLAVRSLSFANSRTTTPRDVRQSTSTGTFPLRTVLFTATNNRAEQKQQQAQEEQQQPLDNILEDGAGHINRELAERIWTWEQDRRKSKNLPVLDYSVRSGLRLVDSLVQQVLAASNHKHEKSLYADLIQEGLSALLDTMSEYRNDNTVHQKADFETFARQQIRRQLLTSLEQDTRPVRLPATVKAVVKQAKQLMKSMTVSQAGREPTLSQVAEQIDIPVSTLQDYLNVSRTNTLSMESTVEISNPAEDAGPASADQEDWELNQGMLLDNGKTIQRDELVLEYMDEMLQQEGNDDAWIQQEQNAGPLQDLIPDNQEPSPDDMALAEMIRHDMSEFLTTTLDPTEVRIVRLLFGLDSGKPLSPSETAKQVEMTTEEVLALLNGGLKKLRTSYTNRYVESYLEDGEEPHDLVDSV